jgi:hypothetical protein
MQSPQHPPWSILTDPPVQQRAWRLDMRAAHPLAVFALLVPLGAGWVVKTRNFLQECSIGPANNEVALF